MTALWIIVAVLVLIAVLLMIPAVLEIEVSADGRNVKSDLVFKYLFIKIKLSKKSKKKTSKSAPKKKKSFSFDEAKNIFFQCRKIYNEYKTDFAMILRYSGKHAVTIKKLDIDVKFDFENPMETGVATGAANAAVYNILAVIDNVVGIRDSNINIQPLFYNSQYFKGKVYSIVVLKNVHIMVILIKSLRVYFKIRKTVTRKKE